MNIVMMKMIDQYLGPPICISLGFLKSILSFFSKRTDIKDKQPSKILLIKFWGMGTILFASPTLRAIKNKFPNSKLTILTLPQNYIICKMLPAIDDVVCFDLKNVYLFIYNFFKTISIIKKEKFDSVIDLEFFANFSSIVTFFSGIENSIGFVSPKAWRKSFYKTNVSFCHDRHIIKIFLKIASALGADVIDDSLQEEKLALIKHQDANFIEQLFKKENIIKTDFLITLNINASLMCLNRRWPKENFVKLVDALIKNKRIKVVLIGGKEDVKYVSEFKKSFAKSHQVINLCGSIDIEQLIALLSNSNLFIGNDSGPLHISTILNIPTVSFFGPETPFLYGPPKLDKHSVFFRDIYCSPCLNVYNAKTSHCSDNQCLKGISFVEVLNLVKQKYLTQVLA